MEVCRRPRRRPKRGIPEEGTRGSEGSGQENWSECRTWYSEVPDFSLDDVITLGWALQPTVEGLLEVARQQEEARREEAEAKRYLDFEEAVRKYGPKE